MELQITHLKTGSSSKAYCRSGEELVRLVGDYEAWWKNVVGPIRYQIRATEPMRTVIKHVA